YLCSSCELGKAKRKSFHSKLTQSSKRRLQLLHMDLCGPMRVASMNGKRYVLVIVDYYSRYTWTHFLRSKDETPEVLIDFLRLVQRGLQAQVKVVRTDKGTEFLNQTLYAYFAAEGIQHQTSVARTPEQKGVVERRNRTLVEAARIMLSAAKVSLFFWAEAIATACFTQNRSLVIPRQEKTPYHIINDRKPSVKFFHIFGSVCYIVRDGENLDKLKKKGDECIFVGYSTQSRAYRVFNKRTRVIMESIHVNFDELPQMASVQISSDPAPKCQTMALEHNSLSQVLVAVGLDSNNGIYPLAYALVEAETKSLWCWFLQCLGDDIDLHPNSNITFISDRQKDKEIDKLMALISLSFKKIYKPTNNNLRTSSNTSHANQDNSPRINRNAGYESQRSGNVAGTRETVECQKPKRAKDVAYHREKMLLCKQEEAGIQLNAEQADWKDDTDYKSDDQELEAYYMYMAKI
nr:retrovirus-related Pol polyprotein from transposon TNT 1-94 [Tanacetum cinerariifolium]